MTEKTDTIALATEITAAWLANPNTRTEADAVPAFLTAMHAALVKLDAPADPNGAAEEPAEAEYPPRQRRGSHWRRLITSYQGSTVSRIAPFAGISATMG